MATKPQYDLKRQRDISHRRLEVARLFAEGKLQIEIADALNVSRATINADLKHLTNEWKQNSNRHINDKFSQELAKLDHLERVSWEAFEESKKETIQVTNPDGTVSKRTCFGSGDSRFLRMVHDCMARRAKMLGFDKPPSMCGVVLEKVVSSEERREKAVDFMANDLISKGLITVDGGPEAKN